MHSATLTLPTLKHLSTQELDKLIEECNQQICLSENTKKQEHSNPEIFFTLSPKERERITAHRPLSLKELRQRVHYLLYEKSQKKNTSDEAQLTHIISDTHTNTHASTHATAVHQYSIDPKLEEAIKLGKYALKDRALVELLWNRLRSHNKIARLLGVNRSSVHRRCKEFGILK